jgi:hypothetical protein
MQMQNPKVMTKESLLSVWKTTEWPRAIQAMNEWPSMARTKRAKSFDEMISHRF